MCIWPRFRALLLVTFLSTAVAGCAGSDGRIPIEGTVTYKGQPVPGGTIQFIPRDATRGTREGALLHEGQYALPPKNGLFPGTYHVSISSVQSGTPAADAPPGAPRGGKQLLPEKYNTKSQLRIEVTPTAEHVFNFNLE
jgi:hypothetical protein